MDTLSIVIPALHEAENLRSLIPLLNETILKTSCTGCEIIVVTCLDDVDTQNAAKQPNVHPVTQTAAGFGGAIVSGFANAIGDYIITMDADFSHPPGFIPELWNKRFESDMLIASRYVPGGAAEMSILRFWLSRILNFIFSRGLNLPIEDTSSGFRLYKKSAIQNLSLSARGFNI